MIWGLRRGAATGTTALTIDAGHYSRVFEVDPQAQLGLSAVEVANGRSPNGVTPTKPGVFGVGFAPKHAGRGDTRRKIVTLDAATVTLHNGTSRSVTLVLDGLGRRRLAAQQELNASLTATQGSGAQTKTLLSRKLHLSAK